MFKTCTAKGFIRANASQPIENFPNRLTSFMYPTPFVRRASAFRKRMNPTVSTLSATGRPRGCAWCGVSPSGLLPCQGRLFVLQCLLLSLYINLLFSFVAVLLSVNCGDLCGKSAFFANAEGFENFSGQPQAAAGFLLSQTGHGAYHEIGTSERRQSVEKIQQLC